MVRGARTALCAVLVFAGACGSPVTPDQGPHPPQTTPTAIPTPPPPPTGVSALLSQTGLYADIHSGAIAAGVEGYAPQYVLWADGAGKDRWVRLPAGTRIDTSDMDHWSFPVGTRFWKEFSVNGRAVETRMITRTGPGLDDFTFAAYHWNAAGTDADYVADGVPDADGSGHDIPPVRLCAECHSRIREHVLGFSAIQLSHSMPGSNIANLSQRGLLTVPAPDGFQVPGDPATQAVLGYLHGNCGNCHNPDGVLFVVPYVLRLTTSARTVADTGLYQTAVGVPVQHFSSPGITHRIAPGDPAASAIFYRMSSRGAGTQMPPIATNLPDPTGVDMLRAWISSLPH